MSHAIAQSNLVANSGFENYDQCPSAPAQLYHALSWSTPTWGTPDYLNVCNTNSISIPQNGFGNQFAHNGNAYAGIYVYGNREYIQTKLIQSLNVQQKYLLKFYISLADSSVYAVKNIGVYFSITSISRNDNLPFIYTPQIENTNDSLVIDKTNWRLIEGVYVANGGEQYLTIGNFHNNTNTTTIFVGNGSLTQVWSYYYIDDVSVTPYEDTTISHVLCVGDSLLAGGHYQHSTGTYYDTTITAQGAIRVTINNLIVLQSHQATVNNISLCKGETYFAQGLTQTQSGTYYDTLQTTQGCDSIVITNLQIKDCQLIIPNVITPNGDGVNDQLQIQGMGNTHYHIIIYTRWGTVIFEEFNYTNDWDAFGLDNGTYYYVITNEYDKERYTGYVQVLR